MIYRMQLAELSRQIAHAARELQGQLETWHRSTQTTPSTHSIESTQSASNIQSGKEWTKDIFQKLTYQEQKLFKACFSSGLVTYQELAERLGIAPTSAKNLVNRLFAHPDKRRLFKKELLHGIARIGVAEPVERKILKGENKSADKKSQHKLTVDY